MWDRLALDGASRAPRKNARQAFTRNLENSPDEFEEEPPPRLKFVLPLIAIAIVPALAGAAPLGKVATQTLTFEVDPFAVIAVSGDPGPIVLDTATPGQQPDPKDDGSTTYALTTNGMDQ